MRERDRDQVFHRELWTKCGEMGLPGLPVPEAYGGSGLDALTMSIALEAFGYGCHDAGLVFAIGAHLCSVVLPIWKFGNEEQKRRYLPGMSNGQLIGVHGMSEPTSGSDAFALLTRAEQIGDGWCLNGTKTFSSNGPVADVALIFAMTDKQKGYYGGVTAFLVERGIPGFQVSGHIEKMGLRTAPMSELILDDVRVGPEAVLGGVGGGATMFSHSMDWERVGIFASHVGQMERLLEKAVEYARTRSQFGQRIGKFQAVSEKIADMKVMLEAARLLVYRAAWKLDHTKGSSMDSSIAKLFVSESLVKTALDTLHIFGGYGYMTEYEIERAVRDAISSTLYSGTSEMQRNIIARWLGL
jgi:alkylation response protein AidB-like acyl-CoA dehydrogenase